MENMTLFAATLLLLVSCLRLKDYAPKCNAQPVDWLASDREALIDFKNGIQDPHNGLPSWRGRHCCRWQGVPCDNITRAVVAIDLSYRSRSYGALLGGAIRPSLMKLKSLRHLDLSYNSFTGIIPAFFGSLRNLQYLYLSSSGFVGKVPPNLRNLTHLKSLYLSTNFGLYAENLQWVTGLVSLETLPFDYANLSSVGTDWLSAINQLPSLIELHLSNCLLSGHTPSLNLTSLSVTDLSSNNCVENT